MMERVYKTALIFKQKSKNVKSLQTLSAIKIKKLIRKYALQSPTITCRQFIQTNALQNEFYYRLVLGDLYKFRKFLPGARIWTLDEIYNEIITLEQLFCCHQLIREYLYDNASIKRKRVWKTQFKHLVQSIKFLRINAHYCVSWMEQSQFAKSIAITNKNRYNGTLRDFIFNRRNFCQICNIVIYEIHTPVVLPMRRQRFIRKSVQLGYDRNAPNNKDVINFRHTYKKYPDYKTLVHKNTKKVVGHMIVNRDDAYVCRLKPSIHTGDSYDYKKIYKEFKIGDPLWKDRPWCSHLCFPDWVGYEPEIEKFLKDKGFGYANDNYTFINCEIETPKQDRY